MHDGQFYSTLHHWNEVVYVCVARHADLPPAHGLMRCLSCPGLDAIAARRAVPLP